MSQPEQRVGEFQLESKLGEGGMGVVFKARQVALDRFVALKFLSRQVFGGGRNVERFYREARAAAKLVHPNIVQIYTIGEHEGNPYFAMEYVEGADLARLFLGPPLTIPETVEVTRSVCKALEIAAANGIIHRDIKPANIMITRTGQVKVMDFGLAKARESGHELTVEGQIVGTPTYMSPEQAMSKQVDTRSDIYSLGCVFYECLAGKPPFRADNLAALIFKHLNEDPEVPTGAEPIPSSVMAVLARMLAKSTDERYQKPSELLFDLNALGLNLALAESSLAARVEAEVTNPIPYNERAGSKGGSPHPGENSRAAMGPPSPSPATLVYTQPETNAGVNPPTVIRSGPPREAVESLKRVDGHHAAPTPAPAKPPSGEMTVEVPESESRRILRELRQKESESGTPPAVRPPSAEMTVEVPEHESRRILRELQESEAKKNNTPPPDAPPPAAPEAPVDVSEPAPAPAAEAPAAAAPPSVTESQRIPINSPPTVIEDAPVFATRPPEPPVEEMPAHKTGPFRKPSGTYPPAKPVPQTPDAKATDSIKRSTRFNFDKSRETPPGGTKKPETSLQAILAAKGANKAAAGPIWYRKLPDGRWSYHVDEGHCTRAEGLAAEALPGRDLPAGPLGDCPLCANWARGPGCALASTEYLARSSPSRGLALLEEQAAIWCAARRFDKAIGLIEEYIKERPDEAAGFRALARVYDHPDYPGKDAMRAIILYQRFVELSQASGQGGSLEVRLIQERVEAIKSGRGSFARKSKAASSAYASSGLYTFQCIYRHEKAAFYAFGIQGKERLLLAKAGEIDPETGENVNDIAGGGLGTRILRPLKSGKARNDEKQAVRKRLETLELQDPDTVIRETSHTVSIEFPRVENVEAIHDSVSDRRVMRLKVAGHWHELIFPKSQTFEAERCALLVRRITGK